MDAIVSDDMIDSFDKRPNDMSIEVRNTFNASKPFLKLYLKFQRKGIF